MDFLHQAQGNQDASVQAFHNVLRIEPDHAEAHLNLGVLYANLNKLDKAERHYQQALKSKPNLIEGHYNLGVFYEFHRKDSSKALAQYKTYVELGGKDERIERLLARTKP